MFNINNNELSYGRGYVYSLQYHLVWCTKYRKKVLKDGIDAECKKMLYDLAEEYKFSGSQIKNVAVAAAFLAAAKKEKVTMKHVLTGVKRELAKTGKQMIASDFGPYYYLMEEQEE